ncbi:Rieske 2Fe-2S domain-containing protein [Hyphococcus sp.]|uniref:Rieske 2Fe-2S domain-containing protein n=1 Tax=Hyphococcus sp. TaxID=2038636 RepID=UPI0035C6B548
MTDASPFPLNVWYMAAWSEEIGETMLARRLFDTPVVLFRTGDGGVAALTDRCPHRFAPLSMGERDGDQIRCPYHGLTFNRAGECVRNPFSDRIPRAAVVKSWRVAERDGIVWLWNGDDDACDEAAIPDFSMLDRDVPPLTGYMPMAANYEFGTDNLLDLSHIEFVHKGSFAGNGVIFAGEHSVVEEGDTLRSNWWMPDVDAPGHTRGVYPPDMKTDHWLDMRWNAPATMQLEIGATPAGGARQDGCIVQQAHILTPETATTTHYFWASSRPTPVADEEIDKMVRGLLEQAFIAEDKPIIEAAYKNLDGADFWDQPPLSLGVDAGGVRARRKIAALLSAQQQ